MLAKLLKAAVFFLAGSVLHAQTERFVTVDKDVKLQVLDWGGNGRALVFLAGLGNDAHVFDHLAAQFTRTHHVYGITRRGFGSSSKPPPTIANYSADRLGDDVLAVIGGLKLDHPVVAGHSIAGEELSSIGSRYPERVAGLIYLDAADSYAAYDPKEGDWLLDMIDVRQEIDALESGAPATHASLQKMLTSLVSLQKSVRDVDTQIALMPGAPPPPPPPIAQAIRFGEQKYTAIGAPVLAIVACPHNFDALFRDNPKGVAALKAKDVTYCNARIRAMRNAAPRIVVVTLPDADHYIFRSNEQDVVRAMNAFLAGLK